MLKQINILFIRYNSTDTLPDLVVQRKMYCSNSVPIHF
jgi:hypothetical protein